MAAFLMGGMAMAQHARHSDKMPEPKVRAERMTERMVKELSLIHILPRVPVRQALPV